MASGSRSKSPVPAEAERQPFEGIDWLLLVAAAGIWGSSFLFMDVALDAEHPGLITWLRPVLGLAALACFPAARRPVERSDHGRLLILGITWMAFPFTLFPLAQQWIDSSVTGMLNGAMPVATIAIGATAFGVVIQRRQTLGVLVGVAGILMIGLPASRGGNTSALGVLLVVVAVSSYGLAVNIAGPLQRKYGSLAVLSRVLAVAVVATAPFGIYGLTQSGWSGSAVGANLAVGIGGTGLAYAAAATLTGRVGALRMSIVTYLIPVIACVLGVLLRDEVLVRWQIVGAVVLVAGAWLTSHTER
ncbi:MAG: DMT family transporter [Actinomycetota bacterium]|nr:DMT family transporter [Actinomycetota bacterium]